MPTALQAENNYFILLEQWVFAYASAMAHHITWVVLRSTLTTDKAGGLSATIYGEKKMLELSAVV